MHKAVTLACLLALAGWALAIGPDGLLEPQEELRTHQPVHPGLRGKAIPDGIQPQVPEWEQDLNWTYTRITDDTYYEYNYYAHGKKIAVDTAGRIHVIWTSNNTPGTYYAVRYARYTPGSGWSDDTCISYDRNSYYNYYPSVACDSSGNVHAVWSSYYSTTQYIVYKRCTPTGTSNAGWDTTCTVLSQSPTNWYKYYPVPSCSPSGRLAVVWYQYYSSYGYMMPLRESTNNGTTWLSQVMVDSGPTSYWYMWYPSCAYSRDNNLHVTFYGRFVSQTSYYQGYYRGRFSGVWDSWENPTRNSNRYTYFTGIAVNPTNNRVHMVTQGYQATVTYYCIMHRARSGTTASDTWPIVADTVSFTGGATAYQYQPNMAFTLDGRGHVAWYGYPLSGSYYRCHYNERSATGTWGGVVELRPGAWYHYYPSVNNGGSGADSNTVYVAWRDYGYHSYGEMCVAEGLPPLPNDVGIIRMATMPYTATTRGPVYPTITLKNFGTTTQTSIPVGFVIPGSTPLTGTWTGTLVAGAEANYSFSSGWTPVADSMHTALAWTNLGSDGDRTNDTLHDAVVVFDSITRVGQLFHSPTFPPPGWGAYPYAATVNWTLATTSAHPSGYAPVVGPYMAYYYCYGAYPPAGAYLISHQFKLDRAVADEIDLDFYFLTAGYTSSGYDSLYVDVSTDSSSWTTKWGGRAYGGSGWEKFRVDLGIYQPTDTIWFRFRAVSDWWNDLHVDSVRAFVAPPYHDVAATSILTPTGTVTYATVHTPEAVVANVGNRTETFDAVFNIGTMYTDTATGITLGPGVIDTVSFASWTAYEVGTLAVSCSTRLSGDQDNANDEVTGTVFVQLFDVEPYQIVAPVGQIPANTSVTPSVWIRNNGSQGASFYTDLYIGSSYSSTRLIVNLLSGDSVEQVFDDWAGGPPGWYTVRCTTRYSSDNIPANDQIIDSCEAIYLDCATREILTPGGAIAPGAMVYPEVRVENLGSQPAVFDLTFQIMDASMTLVFDTTETVNLAVAELLDHTFTEGWLADPTGTYTATAWLEYVGDADPSNDTAYLSFQVMPPHPEGWDEYEPMPLAPSGRPVKRGAWLAYNAGNELIYATKGNKTTEFYSYNPNDRVWNLLLDMPLGVEGKPPDKGSRGVSDNGMYVYATKGKNKTAYYRYTIGDSLTPEAWDALPDVPLGPSGKKVKGGTDMVYFTDDTTGEFVYLLKGYRCEFYKFDIAAQTWIQLPDAPIGTRNKWDKGSWIVMDPEQTTIWAHKAKYHDFYTYDIATETWSTTPLSGMPFVGADGRRKKSKDGGSAQYYNGRIYALKGGNTGQWWRYTLADSTWEQLEDLPEMGSTGRRRRVKHGADVAHVGGGLFYALKGNKTVEFWKYLLPASLVYGSRPDRSGVMAGPTQLGRVNVTVAPNPLAGGFATVRYALPKSGPATITVYDVAGRNVVRQSIVASRSGAVNLDVRHLSAGVYLVRFEAGDYVAKKKLVVER